MAMLQLHNASAAPFGEPLLQGINLELQAGEVTSIIGPNGAGKSTLLHLLGGGFDACTGSLAFGGKPLADWPRLQRARAIALLPQQSTLGFPFTVEEVIRLGRGPHASGARVDAAIVDEVMVATDTASLARRAYTALSGGERQRVQLARVLAQVWRREDSQSRLLLLDEPTNGLDLAHQRLLRQLVTRLATDGCAVVLVVHDFNLVSAMADRVVVLDHGQLAACGTVAEVLTGTMFREVFKVDAHISSHPHTGRPLVIQQ
jgi:iron complex transport system ATP-binding protein